MRLFIPKLLNHPETLVGPEFQGGPGAHSEQVGTICIAMSAKGNVQPVQFSSQFSSSTKELPLLYK